MGHTALHCAAYKGRTKTVKLLLRAGAVTSVNEDGCTAYWAAEQGHTAVLRQLLAAGAAVNAANAEGYTALHWAAKQGHTAVARQLLHAGAAIDA
jgi:ankyrin repeat protein